MKNELTQERLKELLHYDPDTGDFTWKYRYDMPKQWNTRYANKKSGCIHCEGYIRIRINEKKYLAHRLAILWMTGKFPKKQVDHVDGIKDNNKWNNIREATHSENQQNQKKAHKDNKSTGLLGVCFKKIDKKYYSRIYVNNKSKFLGYFKTAQEAHEAYLKAKRELHEFNTL